MQLRFASLAGIVALSALTATTALAQDAEDSAPSDRGFAIKAGAGDDPLQVVLGAQWSFSRRRLNLLRFVPNAHVGFGDKTTTDFNIDLLVRLATGKGWGAYGGIAPTVTIASGESDMGGTWIVGAHLPILKNRLTNLEARFGQGGAPKFRLLAVLVF